MDEITIADKVYVSSKQAAKITGYAKDYIGQLCREGRVEARLVGRNWYVLEDSIREHRFGKAEEEPAKVSQAESETMDRAATWQTPQYVAEEPVFVPDLAPRPEQMRADPAIVDMQSAWKEWFEDRKPAPAVLPDSDEDLKDEYPTAMIAEETLEEEVVMISRMPEEVPAGFGETDGEEMVELHRSYGSRAEGEQVPTSSVPVMDLSSQRSEKEEAIESSHANSSKGGGTSTLRAVFIVIAVASALVALVGTGNAERLLAGTSFGYGTQKAIVDFLGGTSTYESSL